MIALLILLLLSSCMKTEIINQAIPMQDTLAVKPRKELPADSTDTEDTTRTPITFKPSVEDWEEEQDINI